jgi:hypothetical protein
LRPDAEKTASSIWPSRRPVASFNAFRNHEKARVARRGAHEGYWERKQQMKRNTVLLLGSLVLAAMVGISGPASAETASEQID